MVTTATNKELVRIAIEELEHLPSSSLYRSLEPVCRAVYQDQDRFVFTNFTAVAESTLQHVVATLDYLDVPRFFVTVLTNQQATADYFGTLAEPVRVEITTGTAMAPTGTAEPLFNTQGHMCAHAWAGLHVDPNGTARLCCEYLEPITDAQGQPYNIKTHTIPAILDSDYIRQVRHQFRQGTTPSACSTCTRRESAGGTSKRTLAPYKLKNIYGHIDWESDTADSMGFVGGHLGNLCNLKCRICNENFSSTIAAEKIKFSIYQDRKQDPVYQAFGNSWASYSNEFYANLRALVPQVRNFEFLGGEPLLVKENLDFMQFLVNSGHSRACIFEFVTNGTQYPNIFDQDNLFKRLTITLSIDNLGSRFELERSGADWTTVEQNVRRFIARKNACDFMEVGASITVNIQNVYYLPELIKWLTAQGISHYFLNWLDQPAWLALDALTPDARDMVLDCLMASGLPAEDQARLGMIIDRLQRIATSNGSEFCQEMKRLDSIRSQKFYLTHKEIADAMGYML